MLRATTVAAGLLACFALVNAVPAHFPPDKTVVYRYYAEVKAGVIEPHPYASQFVLDGLLYVKHDTTDPTLKNAYYVMLDDLKYGIYNGPNHESVNTDILPDDAKILEKPFLIVYDEMGRFQGVKVDEEIEEGWSRNMKYAIASMMQLDLSLMALQSPIKSHSYITKEHNVHGICQVTYDVRPKGRDNSPDTFLVTKLHEPKKCLEFIKGGVFDHVESLKCHVPRADDMSTASRRVFEIEHKEDHLLIKKLSGYSVINYFPWSHRYEAHYLLTNQTLVYEKDVPVSKVELPVINFQILPLERNVSYKTVDLTFTRHYSTLAFMIKLSNMLNEAADYIKENHINPKEPDYNHGQILNRIMETMSYMQIETLTTIYQTLQKGNTPRDVSMRNIFLEMVPHVGTRAACHFTRNVIRNRAVSDTNAILMVSKLPRYVRQPTLDLLTEMEDLVKLDENVSSEVRKACILSFASLMDRAHTFPVLERFLQHFYDNVTKHPSYEMKLVYLKAMANVRHSHVYKLLTPIITGQTLVTKNPHRIRLHAISAVQRSIQDDSATAFKLLWPVLADTKLPVQMRIASYDVLMEHLPDMRLMMNIYWFMVYEKNEHLYQYHYTTIKSLANSVNPCMKPVAEMARKILRFTRTRITNTILSSQYIVGYNDPKYEHGSTIRLSLKLDELYGVPLFGSLDVFSSIARKPFHQWGIEWYIEGLSPLMKEFMSTKETITDDKIKQILILASSYHSHLNQDIHIDLSLKLNGKTVVANHYDKETITFNKLLNDYKTVENAISMNWQSINYHNLFELHVPTDIGVPAVMGTMIPNLESVNAKNIALQTNPKLNLMVEMELRNWRHGQHHMTIYNPISDTWHSVRRVTTTDVALPINFNLIYSHELQTIKLVLPKLAVPEHSIAGIVIYAKTYVMVTDDEDNKLKKYCSTCKHHEVVTKGRNLRKNYITVYDSRDTLGSKITTAIFNCENSRTPVTRIWEYLSTFNKDNKFDWDDGLTTLFLGSSQQIFNDMTSPESGSCGLMTKSEPSIAFPASEVVIDVGMWLEPHKSLYLLDMLLEATVNVYDLSHSKSIRAWLLKVNARFSPHHLTNDLKIIVTRLTPKEKNLMLCLNAQKTYPKDEDNDLLKLTSTKEVTNAQISLKMGVAIDDRTCPKDDMDIIITYKGEMTDAQKKSLTEDQNGECAKDMQNSLYENVILVPKTPNCIYEAIKQSTLRKLTYDITYRQVPPNLVNYLLEMESVIRVALLPHLSHLTNHTESGNIKVIVEYPVSTYYGEITVLTPIISYHLQELKIGNPVWNPLMDNIRFSTQSLASYLTGDLASCTVYPNVLITPQNTTVASVLPSNDWTLLSGDHDSLTFAVFVKTVQDNKVDMKIYSSKHHVEVTHKGSEPVITVDGTVVDFEKSIYVPVDSRKDYVFRIIKSHHHIIIKCGITEISVICAENSVSILANRFWLQGRVYGLCGRFENISHYI